MDNCIVCLGAGYLLNVLDSAKTPVKWVELFFLNYQVFSLS